MGIGPYMGFQLVREHPGSLVERELAAQLAEGL